MMLILIWLAIGSVFSTEIVDLLEKKEESIINITEKCTILRVKTNYKPVRLWFPDTTGIVEMGYSSEYRSECPSNMDKLCVGDEVACGLTGETTEGELQIGSCLNELYLYLKINTKKVSMRIGFEYAPGICRGGNQNRYRKCGSLMLDECYSSTVISEKESLITCEPDCKRIRCLNEGEINELCLNALASREEIIERCQTYASSTNTSTYEEFICQVSPTQQKIGFYGLLTMTIVFILLLSIVVVVACYNCQISKTVSEPFKVCKFCPECLFPRALSDAHPQDRELNKMEE